MVGFVGNRYDHPMPAQDEDALIRRARRPCGIRRQIGEAAIGIAAEACGVAAAGVRRRERVVGPAARQQALAIPHAILHIEHAELGVVAQRGEAGAGGDEVAHAVGRVLIRAHAEAVGEKPVQRRVIGQAAALDAIADDRTQHVDAAVDVAVHRPRHGGDDGALRGVERIGGVLIDRAVLEADGRAATLVDNGKAEARAHAQQMVEGDQVVDRPRVTPQRRRRGIVDRTEPALLDQPADQRAGDRLGHRPTRRRAVRMCQMRCSAPPARGPARRSECRRCQANWRTAHRAPRQARPAAARAARQRRHGPGTRRIGSARNRRRDRSQARCANRAGCRHNQDVRLPTGDRSAECRIAPLHRGAPVGIIGLDRQAAGAMCGDQLCIPASRIGPRAQAAGNPQCAPAEMPFRRTAIEAGDVHHVGEALGGEVHRALAHGAAARRHTPPDRADHRRTMGA